MSEEAFIRALEACTLPAPEFGHAGHVRAAYAYLRTGDFAVTLCRLRRAIMQYAAALGHAGRYHETMTVAYVALVQRYLHERGDPGDFEAFARSAPELFERDVLLGYYDLAELQSDLARRIFLLPARGS